MDFLWIIAAASALLICAFLFYKIKTSIRSRRILGYGTRSENLIKEELCRLLGEKNVFAGFYLPMDASGERYTEIDVLAVTRGGIAVIEVKSHNGRIDSRDERIWKQYSNGKYVEFHNPILQNAAHIRAVQNALRAEGLYDAPVYSIVVFTSGNVTFTKDFYELCNAKAMIERVRDINRRAIFTPQRRCEICKIIEKTKTNSRFARKKHKRALLRFEK